MRRLGRCAVVAVLILLGGRVFAAEAQPPAGRPQALTGSTEGMAGLSELNMTGLEQLQVPRWGRDPFALPSKEAAISGELTLTAILYHPQSQLAIVNGRMVKVGDEIEGRQVVAIDPDHIVIREGKLTRRLEVPKFTMERAGR